MVGNQANFSPAKFKEIAIPLFSKQLMSQIEELTYLAFEYLESSIRTYQTAESFLNDLLNIQLKQFKSFNVKAKGQSYDISNRLDAEYYLPKYDELFVTLRNFETKRLGDIVHINKSIEPGSAAYQDKGIPFIRVANLSKYGISDTDIFLSSEKYKEVIRPKRETILLSKDGSVGIAYKVEQDMDVITSGAILHLIVIDKDFMPDYLTLVLNSSVVSMQAERDAGGSIIQHWKPSEIENVIIPKLSPQIQQEITDKVRESFMLRKKSLRLLELAKTAVEVAIEQGEDKVMEILNKSKYI